MAAKQRSRRITQPVKKRRAKKRVSGAAAKKRGGRKSAIAVPGMVETALAAFAHEVRTPLTGILAISNLLATSDLTSANGAGSTPSRRARNTWRASQPCSSMRRAVAVPGSTCGRISSTCARSPAMPAIR